MTTMTTRAALPILSALLAAASCGGSEPLVTAPSPAAGTEQVNGQGGGGDGGDDSTVASAAADRAALERLLAEHDRLPPGADRDALARRIDRLAGQRHAAWSRLYWHRDLGAALAEARETGRPVLSLRMLGSLDEDLSCANSRFFRVALYANRELSAYLRDRFVLHWSSERPVPVARIDFGDGRVLERTIAGNSAHYVLDSAGRPVDVLPGLYSPALMRAALDEILPVAVRAGALDDEAQAALVAAHHRAALERSRALFASLGEVTLPEAPRTRLGAETRAMSKAMVEVPLAGTLQLGGQLTLEEVQRWQQDSALWDQIGARLAARVGPARLDASSRALVAALTPTDWARAGQPLPPAGVEALVAAFERVMARDAAHNELRLRPQIHARMAAAGAPLGFAALNEWVYAELFLTPAQDPWLGMATPGVFTGIPADGVVVANGR